MLWTLTALIAATTIDIGPNDNVLLDINLNRELRLALQKLTEFQCLKEARFLRFLPKKCFLNA